MFGFLRFFSPHTTRPRQHFGLTDNNTGALLILSTDFQAINTLREFFPDTSFLILPSQTPAHQKFHESLHPGKFHLLRWNAPASTFVLNANSSVEIENISQLVCKKYEILIEMTKRINILRQRMRKNLSLQDIIYMQKAWEAQDFKRQGYPEAEALQYPYVLQYADMLGISLKEATDQIILKSRIEHDMLAKTESLRIRYFTGLKKAKSREEIDAVYNDFLLDYDVKI